MNINLKKYTFGFLLVAILYLTYSLFVLRPGLFGHFSLIDDGQSIQNSAYFNECFSGQGCQKLGAVLAEKEFGRFRPGYWTIEYLLYAILGTGPLVQHQFRVWVVGLTLLILLTVVVLSSGGNYFGLTISAALFLTSPSLTENLVRLGPVEPYQLIFIVLFMLLMLREKRAPLWICLLIYLGAILIKETTVVILLPFLFMYYLFEKRKEERSRLGTLFLAGLLAIVIGRILSLPLGGKLAYIENFQLSIPAILTNAFHYVNLIVSATSPFPAVIFVGFTVATFSLAIRKRLFDRAIIFWLLAFIFLTIVLFPWRFILERYILASLFFLATLVGIFLSKIKDYIGKLNFIRRRRLLSMSASALVWIAGLNLFFYGFGQNLAKTLNYTNWYSRFLDFESEQVNSIAKFNEGKVYINAKDTLDNWEVLYEIPIHLKFLYNLTPNVERVGENLPQEGYLFSRTSLEPQLSLSDPKLGELKLVDSKSYEIPQIDVTEFTKGFRLRPISTLTAAPLAREKIIYYWEIRALK